MSDITNEAGGDDVMRLRAHAVGIARDIADAFATERNDGNSSAALFRHLADQLLAEPELVKAIAAWHAATLHQVDGGKPQAAQPAARPAWDDASATERTHARRLLARHCSLELRATLSAHQQEWWSLNREREASEADILQVLAAGLNASRVEPDRRPTAGMVLSQEKRRGTGLGPVVIDATARWAGGTHDEYGGWNFSPEAWEKFLEALSEPQPGERA